MAGSRSELPTLADIIEMLQPNSASAADMPGDRAHQFDQQQLGNGQQVPQYDPQAGLATALEWARLVPPSGMIKAFGFYPDGHGGFQPSMKEDLEKGRPISAIGDAIGIASPFLRFGPPALRYFDVKQPPKK